MIRGGGGGVSLRSTDNGHNISFYDTATFDISQSTMVVSSLSGTETQVM